MRMLTQSIVARRAASDVTVSAMSGVLARILVLCRAGWSASFVLTLMRGAARRDFDVFAALSGFLIVDGLLLAVLAWCVAIALPTLSVWVVAAVDSLCRLALGFVARENPGLSGFPVTAVVYLAFVGILLIFDGASDVVISIRSRAALGRRTAHIVAGVCGVMLAVVAALLTAASTVDAIRACLVVVMTTQSVLFATAAFEHVERPPRRNHL